MKTIIAIFLSLAASLSTASEKEIFMRHPLDNMPILEKLPERRYGTNSPVEQRDREFIKFLSASVKIKVSNGSGSGSIVYYDERNNLAYVASCGHLWSPGVLSAEEAKLKKIKCKIVVWYKNEVKLEKPEEFDANVLFYSYTNGIDTSLVSFHPDWRPKYFPIAPLNYKYKFNSLAHSCGCDGGREVAHYEVFPVELNEDLITEKNSPRPGRSGGGLFDEEFYIGTCWGTQYVDGSGIGYFTPLKDIHYFWGKQKEYEFLLGKTVIKGKLLPIINRSRDKKDFSQDYILIP